MIFLIHKDYRNPMPLWFKNFIAISWDHKALILSHYNHILDIAACFSYRILHQIFILWDYYPHVQAIEQE